jgi:hypothetical protein
VIMAFNLSPQTNSTRAPLLFTFSSP